MTAGFPQLRPPGAAGGETPTLIARLSVVETRLAALDRRGEIDFDSVSRLGQELTELTLAAGVGDEMTRAAVIAFQHSFLRRMLENVDVLLERVVARLAEGDASGQSRAAVMLLLDHLGRGLRLHFDHEERDGSLVRALEVAPRFHRRANSLRAEHSNFLACAADLQRHAQRADRSAQRWRSVRDGFSALRGALADHERAENEIVQSAWHDDLGGGD